MPMFSRFHKQNKIMMVFVGYFRKFQMNPSCLSIVSGKNIFLEFIVSSLQLHQNGIITRA